MDLADLPPPTLVQDRGAAEQLLEDLAGHREIAVDTEADSFYCYREKVCLVQFTVEDRDYLLDPLAEDVDLGAFGPIFADPSKTKIFHDGEYDILTLKRDYDFEFAGLFDTRVAAAALGMEAPGLAAVLKHRFEVELDKSMQRSDWARRPLTERQVSYARLDTRFLIPLMHELRGELDARGRTMIVDGECRRLEALERPMTSFRPDDFVKVKGARALAPLERQRARELFVLREQLAEAQDVPPFRVMNNQLLIELARVGPKNLRQLEECKGFTKRMTRKLGQGVLDALARARELGPLDKFPTLPRRDGTDGLREDQVELFDRLKQWRKGVGVSEKIESSYLLNRHVMLRIAREEPVHLEALEAVDGLLGWQLDMFGKAIVDVVARFREDRQAGRLDPRKRGRRR